MVPADIPCSSSRKAVSCINDDIRVSRKDSPCYDPKLYHFPEGAEIEALCFTWNRLCFGIIGKASPQTPQPQRPATSRGQGIRPDQLQPVMNSTKVLTSSLSSSTMLRIGEHVYILGNRCFCLTYYTFITKLHHRTTFIDIV